MIKKCKGIVAPGAPTPPIEVVLQQVCAVAAEHSCIPQDHNQLPAVVAPGGLKGPDSGLFGDDASLDVLLHRSAREQAEGGNQDQAIAIDHLWRGDVVGACSAAAAQGSLSPMWVALAAGAGRKVWSGLCRQYASQLEAAQDLHGAVSYYLACDEIDHAIQVYHRAELFKDALGLARARLPATDPRIGELYAAWAEWLAARHSFEAAACSRQQQALRLGS